MNNFRWQILTQGVKQGQNLYSTRLRGNIIILLCIASVRVSQITGNAVVESFFVHRPLPLNRLVWTGKVGHVTQTALLREKIGHDATKVVRK